MPPNPYSGMRQSELAKIADSDPAAAAELEKRRAYGRAKQAVYRAKAREQATADPAFAERQKAKNARYYATAKAKMDELAERVRTNPEAAAELEEKVAHRRKASRDFADCQKQRAAVDPVFAQEYEAKMQEKRRKHNERQKAIRAELRAQAETDPQAAEKLAALRAKQVKEVTRSRQRLVEAAQTPLWQQPNVKGSLLIAGNWTLFIKNR